MENKKIRKDIQVGRKRTSVLAKNDDTNVIPSKYPKKDKQLNNLSKPQLIQKCVELESSLSELKKIHETTLSIMNNLKKENEQHKMSNENSHAKSKKEVQTQTYPQNDVDFNCGVCVFQSPLEDPLWKHMDLEHDVRRQGSADSCEYCPKTFNNKSDIMMHIKTNHADNVKTCTYFQEGKCMFSDDLCWNSHDFNIDLNVAQRSQYICKYCDKVFKTKDELMKHRKNKHF